MLNLNDIELLYNLVNWGYIKVTDSGKDFINECIDKIDEEMDAKREDLERTCMRLDVVRNTPKK